MSGGVAQAGEGLQGEMAEWTEDTLLPKVTQQLTMLYPWLNASSVEFQVLARQQTLLMLRELSSEYKAAPTDPSSHPLTPPVTVTQTAPKSLSLPTSLCPSYSEQPSVTPISHESIPSPIHLHPGDTNSRPQPLFPAPADQTQHEVLPLLTSPHPIHTQQRDCRPSGEASVASPTIAMQSLNLRGVSSETPYSTGCIGAFANPVVGPPGFEEERDLLFIEDEDIALPASKTKLPFQLINATSHGRRPATVIKGCSAPMTRQTCEADEKASGFAAETNRQLLPVRDSALCWPSKNDSLERQSTTQLLPVSSVRNSTKNKPMLGGCMERQSTSQSLPPVTSVRDTAQKRPSQGGCMERQSTTPFPFHPSRWVGSSAACNASSTEKEQLTSHKPASKSRPGLENPTVAPRTTSRLIDSFPPIYFDDPKNENGEYISHRSPAKSLTITANMTEKSLPSTGMIANQSGSNAQGFTNNSLTPSLAMDSWVSEWDQSIDRGQGRSSENTSPGKSAKPISGEALESARHREDSVSNNTTVKSTPLRPNPQLGPRLRKQEQKDSPINAVTQHGQPHSGRSRTQSSVSANSRSETQGHRSSAAPTLAPPTSRDTNRAHNSKPFPAAGRDEQKTTDTCYKPHVVAEDWGEEGEQFGRGYRQHTILQSSDKDVCLKPDRPAIPGLVLPASKRPGPPSKGCKGDNTETVISHRRTKAPTLPLYDANKRNATQAQSSKQLHTVAVGEKQKATGGSYKPPVLAEDWGEEGEQFPRLFVGGYRQDRIFQSSDKDNVDKSDRPAIPGLAPPASKRPVPGRQSKGPKVDNASNKPQVKPEGNHSEAKPNSAEKEQWVKVGKTGKNQKKQQKKGTK